MLIISRKKDEKIVVADEIEITILQVGNNRVRFGIKAPRHILINTRVKGNESLEPVGVAAAKPDQTRSNVTMFPGVRTR